MWARHRSNESLESPWSGTPFELRQCCTIHLTSICLHRLKAGIFCLDRTCINPMTVKIVIVLSKLMWNTHLYAARKKDEILLLMRNIHFRRFSFTTRATFKKAVGIIPPPTLMGTSIHLSGDAIVAFLPTMLYGPSTSDKGAGLGRLLFHSLIAGNPKLEKNQRASQFHLWPRLWVTMCESCERDEHRNHCCFADDVDEEHQPSPSE